METVIGCVLIGDSDQGEQSQAGQEEVFDAGFNGCSDRGHGVYSSDLGTC